MENIFKNSQNNGMVKANSTRNFLSLFQKQYETGLGNRGKQMLNKVVNNDVNRGLNTNNNKYKQTQIMATEERFINSPPPPPQ